MKTKRRLFSMGIALVFVLCAAQTISAQVTFDNQKGCAGATHPDISPNGTPTNVAYYKWSGGSMIGLADNNSNTTHTKIPSFTLANVMNITTASITVTPYSSGDFAGTPTTFTITIQPRPVITLVHNKGTNGTCQDTDVTFTTQSGQTNYVWDLGGATTVTSGGGSGSNTAVLRWNSPGTKTVKVNYTNAYGCSATTAVSSQVLIIPTPMVHLTTDKTNDEVCVNTDIRFTTESGMTNYDWNLGGAVVTTSGGTGTSNTAVLQWNTPGSKTVTVNYTNANGCAARNATQKTITVLPATAITTQPSVSSSVKLPNGKIIPGSNVELGVTAAGHNLTYQWYWRKASNSTIVPLTNDANYTGSTTSKLLINNAYETQNGDYYVTVTGACNTETSTPVTVVTAATPDGNGIVYVTETGAGTNSGSSWDNAYPGLADPLAFADLQRKGTLTVAPADTIRQIWVAKGTYTPQHKAGNGATDRDKAFVLVNNVKIYGGFAGTETSIADRDWVANVTTLSGDIGITGDNTDNAYHVVISSDAVGTALLDGFTISGGNANNNVTITVNGKVLTQHYGGGMCNYFSSPVLTNVTISGNSANYGGGMYNNTSSPTLTNVTISGNSANNGGGMYNAFNDGRPSSVLTNVTISGNSANYGGGMYNESSSPVLTNSIVWGNTANSGYNVFYNTSTPTYTYSLVGDEDLTGTGTGNLDGTLAASNPLFVSWIDPAQPAWTPTTAGDYRLQQGSPCINAGDTTAYKTARDITGFTGEKDAAGIDRLQHVFIDMGAYESPYKLTVQRATAVLPDRVYGTALAPTLTGGSNPAGADTIYIYATSQNGVYATTPVPQNVGTYWVKGVTVETPSTYADTTAAVSFRITPATVNVTWGNTALIYNGSPQAPTATATGVQGANIPLTVSGAQTAVGSYTATAAMTTPNPNCTLTNTATPFTISMAVLTGAVRLDAGNYNLSYMPVHGTLTFVFSGPMNTTSGTVTLDGNTVLTGGVWTSETMLTLPYGYLDYSRTYMLYLTGFIDRTGSYRYADETFTFTVQPEPPTPTITRQVTIPLIPGATTVPSAGSLRIPSGSNFTFTVTPSAGMEPTVYTNRIINGKQEVLKGTPNGDGSYTFKIPEVRQDIEISVTFAVGNEEVNATKVWSYGNRLYIRTEKVSTLYIYTTGGMFYKRQTVPEGNTTIMLPTGVYFVVMDGKQVKVRLYEP